MLPAQRAVLPRPIVVGYYGAIAEWFDGDLVADLAECASRLEVRVDRQHVHRRREPAGEVAQRDALGREALRRSAAPRGRMGLLHHSLQADAFDRGHESGEGLRDAGHRQAAGGGEFAGVAADGRRGCARRWPTMRRDSPGRSSRRWPSDGGAGRGTPPGVRRPKHLAASAATPSIGPCGEVFPLASIIIVTYNNLALNQACLQSIFRETDYPNYEVIVVDNASARRHARSGLPRRRRREPRLRVICNADNRGFSAANNQGLHVARGEFLCLLNNDTVVTRGWLSTLIGHLRKTPGLGMVGPVSNMVGNEAKVPVGYRDIARHAALGRSSTAASTTAKRCR